MVDLHERISRNSGDVNMRKLKVQVRMNNIAYNGVFRWDIESITA